MDIKVFNKFIEDVRVGNVKYFYYDGKRYLEQKKEILKDINEMPFYTLDGRFEDIFLNILKSLEVGDDSYDLFLQILEEEFKKMFVPNILLLPMSFIQDRKIKSNIIISEHLKLFKTFKNDKKENEDNRYLVFKRNKNEFKGNNKRKLISFARHDSINAITEEKKEESLEKYVENTIYANFSKSHILITKDSSFFNYPILAISIFGIDSKIESESGKIVDYVYSIIRLLDFDEKREDEGWGVILRELPPARTYTVYYNAPNTNPKPPYDNGYGYSFRYNFSPTLDVNTEIFLTKVDDFFKLLNLSVSACFLDKRKYLKEDINFINKWKNALSMFNTAYEFASIKKYDSTILLLLTILESLFLKNTGNKKKELVQEIAKFNSNNCLNITLEKLNELIYTNYKTRNKFVHEGVGIENKISSNRLNNYQGEILGMKPFTYNGSMSDDEDVNMVRELMSLVKDIIISKEYINRLKIIKTIL